MFTQEEHEWIERVKQYPLNYKIIVDNDSVWVEEIDEDTDDNECVFSFNSYGYEFIHDLLNDMGIHTEYC